MHALVFVWILVWEFNHFIVLYLIAFVFYFIYLFVIMLHVISQY